MKIFVSCVTIVFLLLTVVLAAGCSNEAVVPDTAEESDEPALPTPLEQESMPVESDWSVVFNSEISHPVNIVGFLNAEFGITVGYGGEVHQTKDAGQTWPEGENSSMCLFCLDIVDENTAWAGGNSNNVRVTNDGGGTWNQVSDINLLQGHSNIAFIDDTVGWIASLLKFASTNDGGQTWTEMALPEGASSIAAISLRTAEDGYLLSHDGLLYITADGGATWSERDLGLASYGIINMQKQPGLNKINLALADISFTDENNGTVVFIGLLPGEGNRTWCLTTNDGGVSWKTQLLPEIDMTPAKVFLSGDGMYLTLSDLSNQTVVLKRIE